MNSRSRIWELDALRGVAIILMVIFHLIFDLRVFFDLKGFNYQTGFWYYEGRVAAIMFIVLVGMVTSLIHKREEHTVALQKNSYRGLRLLGLGALISMVTYLLFPEEMVWFGILHFLGLSILISLPLAGYKWLNVELAAILFAGYFPIKDLYINSYLGLIFGILPATFSSYDHYALIPWLGYVLLGIALGNWIYPNGQPIIKRPPNKIEKGLGTIGKYSLWIYLLHQPILVGLLWLIFKI